MCMRAAGIKLTHSTLDAWRAAELDKHNRPTSLESSLRYHKLRVPEPKILE